MIFDISENPEHDLLMLFYNKNINIIIRGNLKASKIFINFKSLFNIHSIYRISCLIKNNSKPFLLAPVGIDEGGTLNEKLNFIYYGFFLLNKLGFHLRVGIFDYSLKSYIQKYPFCFILRILKKKYRLRIKLYKYFDIKKAYYKSNLLLLPNGIVGNIIFRTLTHVYNLKGYGAIVNSKNKVNNKIFIDTSRSLNSYFNGIKYSSFIYDTFKKSKY